MRAAIRAAVPGAEERISYGIPTFAIRGRYVVYFSGWKRHLSIYPIPHGSPELEREIEPYRAGKGTLTFPSTGRHPSTHREGSRTPPGAAPRARPLVS